MGALWHEQIKSRELAPGEPDREYWMDPAMFWLPVEKAGVFFPFSHEIIFVWFFFVSVLTSSLNVSKYVTCYV